MNVPDTIRGTELEDLVKELRLLLDTTDEEIFDTITTEVQLTEIETQTLAEILGIA